MCYFIDCKYVIRYFAPTLPLLCFYFASTFLLLSSYLAPTKRK